MLTFFIDLATQYLHILHRKLKTEQTVLWCSFQKVFTTLWRVPKSHAEILSYVGDVADWVQWQCEKRLASPSEPVHWAIPQILSDLSIQTQIFVAFQFLLSSSESSRLVLVLERYMSVLLQIHKPQWEVIKAWCLKVAGKEHFPIA